MTAGNDLKDIALNVKREADDSVKAVNSLKDWHSQTSAKDRQILEFREKSRRDVCQGKSGGGVMPRSYSDWDKLDVDEELEKLDKNLNETKKSANVTKSQQQSKLSIANQTKETVTPSVVRKKVIPRSYEHWDKMDIDQELKNIDEKYEKSSLKDDDKDEFSKMTTSEKIHQAMREKDLGNRYFKMGDYPKAIHYYTRGINCDSVSNAQLFANRAQVYIKQKKWKSAEMDCTIALKIDDTYVKALYRRYIALTNLKKLELAEADLIHILQLEPDHSDASNALKNLRNSKEKVSSNEEQIREEVFEVKMSDVERAIWAKQPMKSLQIVNVNEGMILVKDDSIKSCVETCDISLPKHCSAESQSLVECSVENDDESTEIESTTKDYDAHKINTTPSTYVQFFHTWNKLFSPTGSKKDCFGYLTSCMKHSSHTSFKHLFKQSLEPKLFSQILHVLSDAFSTSLREGASENESIIISDSMNILISLSFVDRISTLIMFISADEMNIIRQIYKRSCEFDITFQHEANFKSVFKYCLS